MKTPQPKVCTKMQEKGTKKGGMQGRSSKVLPKCQPSEALLNQRTVWGVQSDVTQVGLLQVKAEGTPSTLIISNEFP